jgi:hypothetical protein
MVIAAPLLGPPVAGDDMDRRKREPAITADIMIPCPMC